MITIISKIDHAIGFGLAGIGEVIEVPENVTLERVQQLVDLAKNKIIVLNEEFKDIKSDKNLIFIPESNDTSELDKLVKDTLGIKL